jgi:integrase
MMIMWIENLPNGKVKYGEHYMHPLTSEWKKVTITMDKDTRINRKLAPSLLQEKIDKKISKLTASTKDKNLTLSALYSIYYKYLEKAVKKSTYARNLTAGRNMIRILGGDIIANNLSAAYVKQKLLDQDEQSGTTNERIKRFKAMIRWAYENEYLDDIRWLDKIKPQKDEERKKKLEEKFLEVEELTLLLDNLKNDKWRFLAELTALSGMRCGEAIALEDSDIDFEKRIIRVTKTYDHIHKIITTPKTEDSDREIYMQDQLLKLCRQIRKYMIKEQIFLGYRTKLFMSDRTGNYLGYAAFNKQLRLTGKNILGKNITTHYMRHTHVALMAEQGIPLDVIARRLGHSDSKITERIYFHVTKNLKQKDNLAIKDVKII